MPLINVNVSYTYSSKVKTFFNKKLFLFYCYKLIHYIKEMCRRNELKGKTKKRLVSGANLNFIKTI